MRGRLKVVLGVLSVALVLTCGVVFGLDDTPVFLDWLQPEDPGDQTIRVYWERVAAGKATPLEMVDLGTMLFHRGYPKDAIELFEEALDRDGGLAEAWFRIGIVHHHRGELAEARRAYRKCIKRFPGHGWCNFYLAWCEEQLGDASEALHYYRRAFRFAPDLADPRVNPLVLHSDLQPGLSAALERERRFKREAPLAYLESEKVARLRQLFEPSPVPTPVPTAAPSPPPRETASRVGPTPIVRQPAARATPAPAKPIAAQSKDRTQKAGPTGSTSSGKVSRPEAPPGSGPVTRRLRPVPMRPTPTPASPPDGEVN